MKRENEIEDRYIYRSLDVSLFLAAAANQRKIVVNHTKIQKLLFLVYGSYLSVYGKRLLDEHPQCWPYGPVFSRLREKLLTEDFSEVSLSDRRISKLRNDQNLRDIIDLVLRGFGSWSMDDLVNWCVSSAPCKSTPDNGQSIDDYVIRDFFNSLIKK